MSKFTVAILLTLLMVMGVVAQDQVVFSDDFEGGLSDDWTITNDGGVCDWEVFDIFTNTYEMPPDASGNVLAADSDLCGSGANIFSTASFAVNLGSASEVTLDFDSDWRTIDYKDIAQVIVSTDGGITETVVLEYAGVDARTEHVTLDLSAELAFASDAVIKFRSIQPGWDWWWVIDNVTVTTSGIPVNPNPPTDPVAFSDFNTPNSMNLSWTDPTTLVGGDPIAPEDFVIVIQRDGADLTEVAGGTGTYDDNTVADETFYTYDLFTRLVANDSTSAAVSASWWAGGSPTPSAPTDLDVPDDLTDAVLSWTDPSTQDDGTGLDDLDHINVYRNGSLVGSAPAGAETYTDTPPGGSVYTYTVSAVDGDGNESELSNADDSFIGGTPEYLVWVGPDAVGSSAESGDSLLAALSANGAGGFLTTNLFEFGEDLSVFSGVFVVLGIFPDNHTIPAGSAEGNALDTYIANGGRVYLEAGDAFNFDPLVGGYDILPWFDLESGSDGTTDLFQIQGLNDLEEFAFTYVGFNNWMDHLEPISSIPIFENPDVGYNSAVFYAGYGSGRTIGNVPSFGGLVDEATARAEGLQAEVGSGVKDASQRDPRIRAKHEFQRKGVAANPALRAERMKKSYIATLDDGRIEMLANTKDDLMAAYLSLFTTVGTPTIGVTPDNFDVTLQQEDSTAAIMVVSNEGGSLADSLIYSIEETPPVPWLEVSPLEGFVLANGEDNVVLSFSAVGIPVGSYSTDLTVSSNDPANPTVTVSVAFEVIEQADIDVNPTELSSDLFTNEIEVQTFNIANVGLSDLDYTISVEGVDAANVSVKIVPSANQRKKYGVGEYPENHINPYARPSATPSLGAAPVPAGFVHRGGGTVNNAIRPSYGWEAINLTLNLIDLEDPAAMEFIAGSSGQYFAGDIAGDGLFYASDFNTNNFGTLDLETGVFTVLGSNNPQSGHTLTGFTWDPSTSTMYASSTDIVTSILYTVDLSNGAMTQVGSTTVMPGAIDLAASPTGVIYANDLINDAIYTWDKTTGAATLVGAVGYDVNFAQGMDFDYNTGELFLAAYNNGTSSGELRLVDLVTGASTFVGFFGDGFFVEVTAFGIPGDAAGGGVTIQEGDEAGTLAAGENYDVTVIFDATGRFGGTYLNNIVISSNDVDEPEVIVSTTLTVTGVADIAVDPTSLDYDTVFVDDSAIQIFNITNSGTDLLSVTGITTGSAEFSILSATVFDLDPNQTAEIEVEFAPTSTGLFTDAATVTSNGLSGDLTVDLSGYGQNAPVLALSATEVDEVLDVNDSLDVQIVLSNVAEGDAHDLEWSASISLPAAVQGTIITNEQDLSARVISRDGHSVGSAPHNEDTPIERGDNNENPIMSLIERTSYGWEAINLTWNRIDLTNPDGMEFIAGSSGQYFAGDFAADGLFYASDFNTNNFGTIDTLSGVFSILGANNPASGHTLTGFTFDGTTNTMYASSTDIVTSILYTVDLSNGAMTQVGSTTVMPGAIDLAASPDGTIYANDLINDAIYTWDKGTGAATLVGAVGYDVNFAQSMDFDNDTGELFLAAYNNGTSSGELRLVDLGTGNSTFIGFFGDGFFVEVTAFGIPGESSGQTVQILGNSEGTIGGGDSDAITLRLRAGEVSDTTYVRNLEIETNDPVALTVIIPVTITVDIKDGITVEAGLPNTFEIGRNYPNPFNPNTSIKFQLPQSSDAKLVIYNMLGQKVRTLVNKTLAPGYYRAEWDGFNDAGAQVASGVYIYRFEAGDFNKVQKMILLK